MPPQADIWIVKNPCQCTCLGKKTTSKAAAT